MTNPDVGSVALPGQWVRPLLFAPIILAVGAVVWSFAVWVVRGRVSMERDFSSFYFDGESLIFLFLMTAAANAGFLLLALIAHLWLQRTNSVGARYAVLGAAIFMLIQNYMIFELIYVAVRYDVISFPVQFGVQCLVMLIVSTLVGCAGLMFGLLAGAAVGAVRQQQAIDGLSIALVSAMSVMAGFLVTIVMYGLLAE